MGSAAHRAVGRSHRPAWHFEIRKIGENQTGGHGTLPVDEQQADEARSVVSSRLSAAPLKDLRRASTIVQVLVSHGFGYLLNKPALASANLSSSGETSGEMADLPLPERTRKVLEALGPTFVKLGQILSTRADIVPEAFVTALKALQDQAEPLPFVMIREVIERELGRPLDELFVLVEETPLATASIAQVHRATLSTDAGEVEVVIKVQRPGIEETVRADLSLLYWLGKVLEETVEEVSSYSPTAIVEHFEQAMSEELDFVHERRNMDRARKDFSKRPDLLVVPTSFAAHSTSRVLTMTYLDGIKVTDTKHNASYDKEALRNRLIEAAFKQVFEDGRFHGDPHPGNLLVLADGRLGLIDHGLWGSLSPDQQDAILEYLAAIALKSPSTLARLTLKMGQVGPEFDRMAYERDLRRLMERYIGSELRDLSTSTILSDSVELVRKHRIKLPADFAVLTRATATLEGIIRELYPDLDPQAVIFPHVQRLLLQRFDLTRAGPEAVSLLLGLQAFVNEVPTQINQLLHDLSSGRFQVSLRGEAVEELATVGRVHGTRLVLAILCGACILAAGVTLAPFQFDVKGVPVAPVLWSFVAGGLFVSLGITFLFPKGLRKIRLSRLLFWRRGR